MELRTPISTLEGKTITRVEHTPDNGLLFFTGNGKREKLLFSVLRATQVFDSDGFYFDVLNHGNSRKISQPGFVS